MSYSAIAFLIFIDDNSLFLIDYCNTLADCDKQAAQEIRNSMEVK